MFKIKIKAFTLIELLVVIGILGILVTLSTVAINKFRANSRDAERISDVRQIQLALDSFFNENNRYPSEDEFIFGSPLVSSSTGKTLMNAIPTAPTPADGGCPTYGYVYRVEEDLSFYSLEFCISNNVSNISASSNFLIPLGIMSASNYYEQYGRDEFVITVQTDNDGTSNDNQFTIPTYSGLTYNYTVRTSEQVFNNVTGDITLTWSSPGLYEVAILGDFPSIRFASEGDKFKLVTIENWGNINWQSFDRAFSGCQNLTRVNATDAPNLINVTTMYYAFLFCYELEYIDVSNWNLINIENFVYSFYANKLNYLNISNWNLNSATTIAGMFRQAGIYTTLGYIHLDGLADLDISNIETFGWFLYNSRLYNYDEVLIAWANKTLPLSKSIHFGLSTPSSPEAITARDYIVQNFNWTIIDGDGEHVPTI